MRSTRMRRRDDLVLKVLSETLLSKVQDPRIGLVGPLTNNIGNEQKATPGYDTTQEMPQWARQFTRERLRYRLETDSLAFFCVAMRRSVIEAVGLLDEAYGIGFFEDDDYCRRAQQAGYKLVIADDVFVHHHHSVSFDAMGAKAGEYLAKLHPAGSGKVKVAWFPGPPGAGWVEAGNTGFVDAVKGSDIEIVDTKYGDTGKEVQLKLVEDVLEANPDINYIVGTSPTAEASVGLLKDRGLTEQIKVLAYYFTPPVYQGIKDGSILAAPTDSAVIQGRVAIDQMVRILEGKPYEKHVGPALYVIDSSNVNSFDKASSLAPDDFKPTFSVD